MKTVVEEKSKPSSFWNVGGLFSLSKNEAPLVTAGIPSDQDHQAINGIYTDRDLIDRKNK